MLLEQFKLNIISQRQKLFFTAFRFMQNEEDAEDAVQETLLRLWSMRQELDTVVNPGAFAMQTVKNICIDRIRTRKEQVDIENFSVGSDTDTPYLQAERNDTVAIVRQIIEHLPELQKIIIRMRDIEGYELQEIADLIQTQVSAVSMNLSRARKKVREQLMKRMYYGTK
ncbi:MAG: sigma-70 family RNA polymerase sigma factor [Dysgonamonadaceae bacterium]|jgi:RNA polymerase sigma-70 factor (ECF subfamily)|nr:sigma-70 family RNA polymerase sigma factor [Dysgonamonadaceae bacterium]